MNDNDRFGLSLSLVEALRTDPSPTATALADLLTQSEPPSRAAPAAARRLGNFSARLALAGLALTICAGAQSYAAAQPFEGAQTLQGRWTMAARQSRFNESVTGAAPDAAVMIVTQDSHDHLTYELSESREGVQVAHGAYDISLDGPASVSRVGDVELGVSGARDSLGDVVIAAPPVGPYRAVIHVHRTGPDSLLLEHDVVGAGQSLKLEEIRLVRSGSATTRPEGWAQASNAAP